MKTVGAHVSAAGGVENAPLNAAAIGADAFALFTKNQRQWSAPPLTEKEIAAFKNNCQTRGFSPAAILPHDSYLINLANPDPEKWRHSLNAFKLEMQRCESLGLIYLNFHPGSHLNIIDEKAALRLVADALNEALSESEFCTAVIENTAGQGTNLGSRFENLAEIISHVKDQSRIGICLDTCHTFAAGYDLSSEEGCDAVFSRFDALVGFQFLRGMHLNDSMKGLGCHVDRHATLGNGTLGLTVFQYIMRDPRFNNIPLILETPDPDQWATEIKLLRSFEQ